MNAIAAGALAASALIVQALPVAAITSDPDIIAVHQNGAIDVPGNSTLGRIASVSLPAGNWSITATATAIGTVGVGRFECQLIAGKEFYKSRTLPTGQGVASYQPIVLLLAHHFSTKGTATLACYSDGWLGNVLMRDIHLTAVKVGQLFDGGVMTGTGSPQTYYAQNSTERGWTNNAYNPIQQIRVPAGTWLVQATAWGIATKPGDGSTAACESSSATGDQSFGDWENGTERNIYAEGVLTLSTGDDVTLSCKDADGLWVMFGSAMTVMSVGTFKYGQLGGRVTTTGSGGPTVVGGYGGPGGITDTTALASVGSMSLTAGSWFVTSKLSFQAGAGTPNVTCQTKCPRQRTRAA